MKLHNLLFTAALLAAVFVVPAAAMEYTIDGPDPGDFGAPTSDETIYVESVSPNRDRSKNAALIPPGFGTPTSNLPGSGDPLTPNLAGDTGTVTAINPSTDGGFAYPGGTPADAPSTSYPATAYTAVTSDSYYNAGHLGTLKIPTLGLTVKVYQGTDSAQLAKGAGHFTGTSIWDGNVCLAAHNRGVNNHFGQIHTLDEGDRITLTTKNGVRTYEVTGVYKISETDNSMLAATAENCITLFTCVRDQRESRWCVRAVEI